MAAQRVDNRRPPLFAPGCDAFGIERHPGGDAPVLRMAAAMGVVRPRMLEQVVLDLVERHALVFKFDDAVLAAKQFQAAAGQFGGIGGLLAACRPRRFQRQRAAAADIGGNCRQQCPRAAAFAQRHRAGFGAAVHIVREKVEFAVQHFGGALRQHAAGADDAAQVLPQPRPVARFAQAVQQRRAGNPDAGRAAGGDQVFGINALAPAEHPAAGKRGKDAETQAVQMLRADATVRRQTAPCRRQPPRERRRFGLHLGKGFFDDFRFAGRAGGFQPQAGTGGRQRHCLRRRVDLLGIGAVMPLAA